MNGLVLETRVVDAEELIIDKQGITTKEVIKRMGLEDPTKPKSAAYKIAKIKKKLGRWLFVQKDGKLTRWFSREYARKHLIVSFVAQDKNKNYDNPQAKEEQESVRLMRMFNNLMVPGRA